VASRPDAISTQPARPSLRLIRGAPDPHGWPCFCGECAAGAASAHVDGSAPLRATQRDALPARDDAFLVIDQRLRVQTVSRQAATLLGESEQDMIDRPVAEFLDGADSEAQSSEDFLQLIRRASIDSEERQTVFVRPRNAFGIRMVARVVPCGHATLVLLRSRALRVEIRRGALR